MFGDYRLRLARCCDCALSRVIICGTDGKRGRAPIGWRSPQRKLLWQQQSGHIYLSSMNMHTLAQRVQLQNGSPTFGAKLCANLLQCCCHPWKRMDLRLTKWHANRMMTRMKNPKSSQGRSISLPRWRSPTGPRKRDRYACFQAVICSVRRLQSRGREPPDTLVCLQNLPAQQQQAALGSSGKGMLGIYHW